VVYAVAMEMQGPLLTAMKELVPQMRAVLDVAAGVKGAFDDVNAVLKDFGGELKLTHGTLGSVNEILNVFGVSLRDVIKAVTLPSLPGAAGALRGGKPNMLQRAGAGINDWLFEQGVGVPRFQPPPGPTKPWERPEGEGFLRPPDSGVSTPGNAPTGGGRGKDSIGPFLARIREGMGLAIQSMRQGIGQPAQFSQDLGSVWRSANLAGLNEDPIAKKQMDLMLQQLQVMEQMLAELSRREAKFR